MKWIALSTALRDDGRRLLLGDAGQSRPVLLLASDSSGSDTERHAGVVGASLVVARSATLMMAAVLLGACASATPGNPVAPASPGGVIATGSPAWVRATASPDWPSATSPAPIDATGGPSVSADKAYTLGHFPDAPMNALSEAEADEFQAILDAAVNDGLPGVTATVLAAERGAWSGAAGRGDRDDAMETRSQFGIASTTKTVVAASVLRLAEEGVLRLSDPVSDHLPASIEFDTNGATVEDLLSMESGIPDPGIYGGPDPLREWHPQEILDSVPSHRAQPNERFAYSNTSYFLLGLVIEEKMGMSVAAALRAHVLSDPRLDTLVYQPEERPAGPLALPLHRSDSGELGGGYLSSMALVTSGGGGGCMASDSEALALWGYLLFGGDILSDESLLAMTDFGTDGYGLGTFDQTELADGFDVPAIGNGGWDDAGYSTVLSVLPSEGIVISVLTNVAGDPKALVMPVAQRLASALQD